MPIRSHTATPACRRDLPWLLCLALFGLLGHGGAEDAPLKVLFFTKSAGYEHAVIKHAPDTKSFAMLQLDTLAPTGGFTYTETKDGKIFTAPGLDQFDVFLFYTTGDLTADSKDGAEMGAEGKAALLKAVQGGKGFVGLHCAADTFHSPGGGHGATDDGDKRDPYIAMLGGEFIIHGAQQKARITVTDPAWPGLGSPPPGNIELLEEWYALKNFANDLHVILAQDTAGMKGGMYARGAYPQTWARLHGQGRVFYTSLGHREDVWKSPAFQGLLIHAIRWTGRRAEGPVTTNLDQATPAARAASTGK